MSRKYDSCSHWYVTGEPKCTKCHPELRNQAPGLKAGVSKEDSHERQTAAYEAEMRLRAQNVKALEEREKRGEVVDVRQYKDAEEAKVELTGGAATLLAAVQQRADELKADNDDDWDD